MGPTELVLFKEERISMVPSTFIICSKTEFAIKYDELIEVYIIEFESRWQVILHWEWKYQLELAKQDFHSYVQSVMKNWHKSRV